METDMFGFPKGYEQSSYIQSGVITDAKSVLDFGLSRYRNIFTTFRLILSGFIPATDDVELGMRTSADNGETFASAAASYTWVGSSVGNVTALLGGGTSDSIMRLSSRTAGSTIAVGNGSAEGIELIIDIFNAATSGLPTRITFAGQYAPATTDAIMAVSGSARKTTIEVDTHVRLLFSSGNITRGIWSFYGYN